MILPPTLDAHNFELLSGYGSFRIYIKFDEGAFFYAWFAHSKTNHFKQKP